MAKTTVKFRLTASLASGVARMAISFVTGIIIARTLGPAKYGDLNFLLSSFAALVPLVDMGASNGFYTSISQRRRPASFFLYYALWLLVQLLVLMTFVLLSPQPLRAKLWLGQGTELILLALFACFSMNHLWNFTSQIGESIRDTWGVQLRNLMASITYMFFVVILAEWRFIGIRALLIVNGVLYFAAACAYGLTLWRRGLFVSDAKGGLQELIVGCKAYVFPFLTLVGFIYSMLDPWLLQKCGGSIQQGFYAAAARLAMVAALIGTAITPILWKEVAEAFAANNDDRVRFLVQTTARAVFFSAAVVSCFAIPFAKEILLITLGRSYESAWIPFSLMMIYPLFQSANVVYDTALLAIERAKMRTQIVIAFMVLSIAASYFFLASPKWLVPGMGLGALGLVIKMVACQVVQMNLEGLWASKYIKARFDWQYQVLVIAALMPIGFVFKLIAGGIWSWAGFVGNVLWLLGIASGFYVCAVIYIVYTFPHITGLSRQQRDSVILSLKGKMKGSMQWIVAG